MLLNKMFKGFLKRWIRERALRLPDRDVDEIAKTLHVPREVVVAINEAIIEWVIKQIE